MQKEVIVTNFSIREHNETIDFDQRADKRERERRHYIFSDSKAVSLSLQLPSLSSCAQPKYPSQYA